MQELFQHPTKQHCTTRNQRTHNTTGRLDHPDPEDIEGKDFKCYLMKMMETLKEEVKNSLKVKELKTNKKLIKIDKFLKDNQEN